ncbi:MAG: DNA alkylation repair protein [Bdellovibrionales bacterium]|nr:DNA alkylation repair protein [Bdellovibrionales bacterium]
MAELLKNSFDKKFINTLSLKLDQLDSKFNRKDFTKSFQKQDWEALELKQRIRAISHLMHEHLRGDYKKRLQTLISCSEQLTGFQSLVFPDYVQVYGLDLKNEDLSLSALKELTKYSTSEYAIRPFIKRSPEKLMKTLLQWSKDDNYHVRRLSSEGCRPRLPWGGQLRDFINDPALILPILVELKADPSDYVRKSVANNLNDISKDHPQIALDFAKKHWGQSVPVDRTIKHGLRTLLKSSNTQALKIIGYNLKSIKNIKISTTKTVPKNKLLKLNISYEVTTPSTVRVEYKMHFLKANNTYTTKVFKVSEKPHKKGHHSLQTHYNFKPISTRKYYSGEHFVSAVINGKESDKVSFKL